MKQIVSLLITFLCYTSIQAKERIVELPAFDAWSSTSLEVQKIVLNDTATIVYIDAFYRPHNWIKTQPLKNRLSLNLPLSHEKKYRG